MNYKSILRQALRLLKAYMASKRGRNKVAGVANLFGGLVGQLDDGIKELEEARVSLCDRIDELTNERDEQEDQLLTAENLRRRLKELTD